MSWAIALITLLHIPAGHAQTPEDSLITSLVTLNVTRAGMLSDLLSSRLRPYITKLKLIGQLNRSDIRVIREMAGAGVGSGGKLAYLDLSEAELVPSGLISSKFDITEENDKIKTYCLFENCSALEIVKLPPFGIDDMSSAFRYCTSLTSVDLPEDVTNLDNAFVDCRSLTSVDLPEGVTNLSYAFKACYSLTSIDLPESVTNLDNAFVYCRSLTSVNVPASVTNLEKTFSCCEQLKSVNILGNGRLTKYYI